MTEKRNVALITGSFRRIGAVIAERFLDAGWNVILHGRAPHKDGQLLFSSLKQKHGTDRAAIITGTFTRTEQAERLIAAALEPWGQLDALVNNASTYPEDNQLSGLESELGVFAANALGPWHLSLAAKHALVSSGGAIVNLIDNRAAQGNVIPGRALYGASKAAMLSLSKSLAKEFAPSVRVNAVAPGMILPTTGEMDWTEQEKLSIPNRVLLGRCGEQLAVADAVVSMATATHITGQVLVVDGGEGLAW